MNATGKMNSGSNLRRRKDEMRKTQKGFSLIELLIVVAIILIIAAIAIPNLLRARISANEASAVSSLRTYNTACITYNSTYGYYPPLASDLGPSNGSIPTSTSADLLDQVLGAATPQKSGYNFTYTVGTGNASQRRPHLGRASRILDRRPTR
jgi:prepilin-type N-terminal cleavage/methylation domain-containing protein